MHLHLLSIENKILAELGYKNLLLILHLKKQKKVDFKYKIENVI